MEKSIIFQSNIMNGPMSNQSKFYPDGMTKEEIWDDVYRRRMELGGEYGFDGRKIMVPLQNGKYQSGKYIVLNDESVVYQDRDLWEVDLECDIMVIKKGLPGVMMAYPCADCPVIIMKDKKSGTLAFAHCNAAAIDNMLPISLADSLLSVSGASDSDIMVYVGPSAGAETYYYDKYPSWAINDKIWKYCIKEKDGLYYIDLRKAILMELELRRIEASNIEISNVDTITSLCYYSNHAAYHGDMRKNGRMLVGCGNVLEKDFVKSFGSKIR